MSEPVGAKLEFMFPTPLVTQQWPDSEGLNEALRRVILAREAADAGNSISNIGGWQSSDDLPAWAGPAGEQLMQRALTLVNEVTRQLLRASRRRSEFEWKLCAWANVNRRGQYNMVHSHGGSTWSGTYYVDAGDQPADERSHAGCLALMNPDQGAATSFLVGQVPATRTIRPVDGLMVLFPSHVPHMVHPYAGERPRISIAFNVKKEPFP